MGEAGRGKGPARVEGETPGTWNPEQGCLEVETKRVLELGSLSTVLIKLVEGEICIEGTDKVQQPELTITERIYAGSKSEATRFYKENGSGVNVEVDSDTLSVTEKSSSGVVSGGSGNVQIEGRSGSVVVDNSYVRGNIFNRVNGGTGGIVIINGEQTGSSQPVAGRETRVVLKVPVANKGEKSEPEYIIEVGSGNITVENVTGEYDISLNTGNIEVTDGIFISENTGENTVKTETGDISVGFDRDQGKIKVQTIQPGLGGRVIKETIYFEGVENPNGQTARLILTTQAGGIEVISK